jgi:glycosyltransferase involved in cell wall biosynthesis
MDEALATVIIPCLNGAGTLGRALQAINSQACRAALRVIVVDNGSTDGSVEIAQALADQVLQCSERGSFRARNHGLAHVRTPLLLSLDADCEPADRDWAGHHISALLGSDDVVIASAGRTIAAESSDRWANRSDVTPYPGFSDGEPLYAVGGNRCFRTEALRRLGGFPPLQADDAALGVLARRFGYRFTWTPASVVYHQNPEGWIGFALQMRKVGRYAAEIAGPPESYAGYYLGRLKQLLGAGRYLARRDWHEALAAATKAIAQSVGAHEVWRSGEYLSTLRPAPDRR